MDTDRTPSEKKLSWKLIFTRSISFIRETPVIWIFGALLSLPFLAFIFLESFLRNLPETDLLTIAPRILILFLLCILLFLMGEAALILSLKKTSSSFIESLAATGALIRWYFLFLFMLLCFFAFFFAPISFAPPSARPLLQNISLAFFLFIISGAFVLKMFGSFYLLLGKLSIGSALKSSATLLMDHFTPSSILFLATIAFSLAGSILIDAFHSILSFPLAKEILRNVPLIAILMFLATFFNIFLRIFWYFFFETIAAEKSGDQSPSWQKKKKMVEESMVPAEDEA